MKDKILETLKTAENLVEAANRIHAAEEKNYNKNLLEAQRHLQQLDHNITHNLFDIIDAEVHTREAIEELEIARTAYLESLDSAYKAVIDEAADVTEDIRTQALEIEEQNTTKNSSPEIKVLRKDGAWTIAEATHDGKRYEVNVKHHDEPSQYGIKAGRISKLWICERGKNDPCTNYDRGWDIRPSTKAAKTITDKILALYN